MTHAAHVPADFVSTFRRRFAPLFGRKIGRQRSEQYLGGLLGGRAERRNVTALAGTVDGATARALGWLLNKSPWQTRPIVDALQKYVGDTFGEPEGLFTLNLDSFVKRGDNAVGVEKQYVHHLGRTQNCQIGVFLAYGAGEPSALVDAAIYMPHAWIENAPRREKAGVPASLEYQSRSALALGLLRNAREAGHLPGGWVTSWHGEGFEADLRAGLDADGWRYLLPVSMKHQVFASADAAAARPVAEVVAGEAGGSPIVRRVWEGRGPAGLLAARVHRPAQRRPGRLRVERPGGRGRGRVRAGPGDALEHRADARGPLRRRQPGRVPRARLGRLAPPRRAGAAGERLPGLPASRAGS